MLNMNRLGEQVGELSDEPEGEVLVEKQSHAAGTVTRRRSRSAANARQALMSSAARSGKSVSISCEERADVGPPKERVAREGVLGVRVHAVQTNPRRDHGRGEFGRRVVEDHDIHRVPVRDRDQGRPQSDGGTSARRAFRKSAPVQQHVQRRRLRSADTRASVS